MNGTNNVGGLIGSNSSEATISNSYSMGDVTRISGTNTNFGGFVGYNMLATIEYCYSIGNVYQSEGVAWADGSKGFIGFNLNSTTTSNFFDNDASNQSTASGAEGKTTEEMKTNTTFLNAGWNSLFWYMDEGFNNGYPYLSWQNPGGPPLPVELISFTTHILENEVVLRWQTAAEVNNYGFQVEKKNAKVESEEWKKIGFVEGHGNSNSLKNYSFSDRPIGGISIKYRLKQIDTDGRYEYSPEVEVSLNVTADFSVKQNYPNPFNPTTKIEFAIPLDNKVQIKVFNVLGIEVTTLLNENRQAGKHSIEFNATNLSSGVYYYKIVSGNYSETKKMILLR